MIRIFLLFILTIGTSAKAIDPNDSEAAAAEYNKSYLQVEECLASEITDREACFIAGIRECSNDLEAVLEIKGFFIPGGVSVSPREYCNIIGLERADEHLNVVYQRILEQGLLYPHSEVRIASLRTAQRLWLQFANEMCSEGNIVGWHMGGSGWGAVTDECTTRLSLQQAGNLERFFAINY